MRSIHHFFILVLSVFIILGCSSQTDRLTFSEFEIKDDNGLTRMKVNEAGEIRVDETLIGSVMHNGNLTDKKGELIASITTDNMLQDKAGKNLVKIDKNGRIDNGSGLYIQWSENGELMKGNESAKMMISPIDANSFQAASIIIYLYFMFTSSQTPMIVE